MIDVKANKVGLVLSGEVNACISKAMGFQLYENLHGVLLSSPAGKVCLLRIDECRINGKQAKSGAQLIDEVMKATHPKTLF